MQQDLFANPAILVVSHVMEEVVLNAHLATLVTICTMVNARHVTQVE